MKGGLPIARVFSTVAGRPQAIPPKCQQATAGNAPQCNASLIKSAFDSHSHRHDQVRSSREIR
jgi:hypothetical protein